MGFGLFIPTATADILSFQDSVDGYTGTRDTMIAMTFPGNNFGGNLEFGADMDGATGGEFQGLLSFLNIFGAGAGQIPLGSTIISATLELTAHNSDLDGPSFFHEMLQNWDENVISWNSAGGEILANGIQAKIAPTVTNATGVPLGVSSFDVTSSLANWSAGQSNFGWLFRHDSADATLFRSSEFGTIDDRPRLRVEFTPIPAPGTLAVIGIVFFDTRRRRA